MYSRYYEEDIKPLSLSSHLCVYRGYTSAGLIDSGGRLVSMKIRGRHRVIITFAPGTMSHKLCHRASAVLTGRLTYHYVNSYDVLGLSRMTLGAMQRLVLLQELQSDWNKADAIWPALIANELRCNCSLHFPHRQATITDTLGTEYAEGSPQTSTKLNS